MKNKQLFVLWGAFFVVCAGLGFIPAPAGFLKAVLVIAAIGFFVPPVLLLRRKERAVLTLLRNLSALSLLATLVLLIANVLSVLASELVGNLLHYVLVVVSTPMVCGQYWALSLFGWACLMIASHTELKKQCENPRT